MEYIILIYDKINNVPIIGGKYDTKEKAEEDLLKLQVMKREDDKNDNDYGCWAEETNTDGKTTFYYVSKDNMKKTFIKDNNGNKKEKYILDLTKARKFYKQGDAENLEDLKDTIKVEIISIERNKLNFAVFSTDEGYSLFDDDDE